MERERVLSIRDLEISFDTVHGKAAAIRGMRFDLYRGETVAIVGESGSGKSVTSSVITSILIMVPSDTVGGMRRDRNGP